MSTPGEQLAVVRRFNNDLSVNRDKPPGDPVRGRTLFQQYCAACHRLFDEGGTMGPDLTAANRMDKEFLLISLVDPSAVIRKEFLNYAVQTTDGRTLHGQVAGESASSVTLVGANNETVEIARDRIASMEDTGVSLMPRGLLDALTPQQRRDLFSYLQSEKPPR